MTYTKFDLIDLLKGSGSRFKGNAVQCPLHDDKHPSAGIYEKNDKWMFSCRVCDWTGDLYDLKAELEGKELKEVLPKREKPMEKQVQTWGLDYFKNYPNAIESYFYSNPETKKVDLIVVKLPDADKGKTFRQFKPYGQGFTFGAPTVRPLYNRGRVATSDRVLIVEGEKCVHSAHSAGIVATTSSGGANGAKNTDWTPIKGKDVYIWPDNDENGAKYAEDVAKILTPIAKSVRVFDPAISGVAHKGDIADFMDGLRGMPAETIKGEIWDMLEASEGRSASDGYSKYVKDAMAGAYKSLEGPWPELQNSKYLMAGSVTTLCGNAGTAKSWFSLQLFLHLTMTGHNCHAYQLEETLDYWIGRCVTMASGEKGIVDPDWLADPANHKRAEMAINNNQGLIAELSKNIKTSELDDATHEEMIKWMTQVSEDGAEFILVDPVTAIGSAKRETWEADRRFVLDCGRIARKYKNRILLVTHPKSGNAKEFNLDSMAGGTAYNRFVQNIFWLINTDHKMYEIRDDEYDLRDEVCNKILMVMKGRNNKMQNGNFIGMEFSSQELKFIEKGALKDA